MFPWLKKSFSAKTAIAGVVDAVLARISEYEFRVTMACENQRPYYSFAIVKRPAFIDLDGDGKAD